MQEIHQSYKQQHKLLGFPIPLRKITLDHIVSKFMGFLMIFGDKRVSTKYSRVLGISKIDFTPAEITAIGALLSSVRSDNISIAATTKGKMELGHSQMIA